jgi:hypothetical protein
LVLSTCGVCSTRTKEIKTKLWLVSKPFMSNKHGNCQMDLIDMQTKSRWENTFIVVYRTNCLTVVLRRPDRAEQVAYHPRSVFITQVSLCILHPNYHNSSVCWNK